MAQNEKLSLRNLGNLENLFKFEKVQIEYKYMS